MGRSDTHERFDVLADRLDRGEPLDRNEVDELIAAITTDERVSGDILPRRLAETIGDLPTSDDQRPETYGEAATLLRAWRAGVDQ